VGCIMLLFLLLAATAALVVGSALLGTFAVGLGLLLLATILLFVRTRTPKRRRLLGALSATFGVLGLVLCLSIGGLTWYGARAAHDASAAAEAGK